MSKINASCIMSDFSNFQCASCTGICTLSTIYGYAQSSDCAECCTMQRCAVSILAVTATATTCAKCVAKQGPILQRMMAQRYSRSR